MNHEQAQLLASVKPDILAHRNDFNMWGWVVLPQATKASAQPGEIFRGWTCGTTCCIAGAVLMRSVGVKVIDGMTQPGEGLSFGYTARRILGLTLHESESLFNRDRWCWIDPDFSDLQPTPENAVMVIDAFLASKGFSPNGDPITN